MGVLVGCDLGTAGAKAAVFADDGALLGEAFEESVLRRPAAGQVEQDLGEIERAAHRVIGRALAAAGSPRSVAAVAISSQMSGIGTIDDEFRPASRYDSWLDNRCEPYIARLADRADEIIAIAGCPPTYSHLPKMLYWRDEHPDVWDGIRAFVPPSSFVAARLAGLAADDAYLDSSYLHFTNLADTARGVWSERLLELAGLDDRRLPRILEPTAVIGAVTRAAAEATGLPVGTPIAAGAGDTAAAVLGAGAVEPGQAVDVAGTASVLAFVHDGFHPDVEGRTLMFGRHLIPERFIALAFVNGGGLALRWFRDEVAPDLDPATAYEQMSALAAEAPPGSDGLVWFPHLQGRVVPPQPHLRAAWLGLTSRHGRSHLVRSMFEGIAYEYRAWSRRSAAGGTAATEVRAVGGGAASAVWNGIKADIVGVPWTPVRRQECGVLGDALIAAAAVGAVDDLAAAATHWQEVAPSVVPSLRRESYDELAERYARVSARMPEVFDDLNGVHE